MNSFKNNVYLFLGTSLMLIVSSFSSVLLRDVKDCLLVSGFSPEIIPQLKLATIPITLIVGMLMILLSWSGGIGRVFKVYFSFKIVILILFAIVSYVNSPWINKPGVISSFYVFANISTIISVMLVWGFANQEYTFEKAAIQYPILFLISSISPILYPFYLSFLTPKQNVFLINLCMMAVLSFLTLAIYLWMSRGKNCFNGKEIKVRWGYWVALAVIVFTVKIAAVFPLLAFKSQVGKGLINAVDYNHLMIQLSAIKTWGLYIGFPFIMGLGIVIYSIGPKSLTKVAGFVIFGMLLLGSILFYICSNIQLDEKTILVNKLNVLTLNSLTYVLILLKELSFFGIDRKSRITAKIAVDFIFYVLALLTPTIMIGVFPQYNQNVILLASLFIMAVIGCFAGFFRIDRDLKFVCSVSK